MPLVPGASLQVPSSNQGTQREPSSGRTLRIAIVLLGILIGQAVLYGPSLAGSKILLPLDILALPDIYLPQTEETARIVPHNFVLSDLIDFVEPHRRFLGKELHAGRMPHWNPYQFAGAPDVRDNFSPFYLLAAWFESPKIIAWVQLLAAGVAGMGTYVFCRRSLEVGFRASAIIAWCYPLTGFLVLWQGFPLEFSAIWLPWLLAAVDRVAKKPDALGIAALGTVTTLSLISGQLDIAALVLMVSGFYAVWHWLRCYLNPEVPRRHALLLMGSMALGWSLGFLLAAPDVLPMVEYTRTSERMSLRLKGNEERPPIGLASLPQVVWPTIYGSTERGSFPIFPPGQGNLQESSAAAYAGLLALLLAAPLGWCARRHRATMFFFSALGFLALGWTLNVPGVVDLLRLPGLNMLSYNRWMFAVAFSTLAMAAIGLDALDRSEVKRQKWFWIPTALLGALLGWAVLRTLVLPEPVTTQLAKLAAVDKEIMGQVVSKVGILSSSDLEAAQDWFWRSNLNCALLCTLGILAWLWVGRGKLCNPQWLWALGVLLVGDLLWFGTGRSAQCDPQLSFSTSIPALEAAARSGPGRFMGYNCLPANVGEMIGLPCIQGYDGVNPARLMALLRLAASPQAPKKSDIMAQYFQADLTLTPPDIPRLSPLLDMLNVRYVVFRGTPPAKMHPSFQSPDYWILTNPSVLERAFVPGRVETVTNPKERLSKLASPDFDARKVAFIESAAAAGLPNDCRGAVQIVDEIPCRVTLSAQMETSGLVVLADLWDNGWQAWLDGQPVPVERANHALRGVVVPAGSHALEFRYAPASLLWGWRATGVGGAALVGLLAFAAWRRKAPPKAPFR